jgi:hypothetical protein
MLRYRHQVPPFRRSEAVPYLRGVHEFPVEFEALVAYLTAVDPAVRPTVTQVFQQGTFLDDSLLFFWVLSGEVEL